MDENQTSINSSYDLRPVWGAILDIYKPVSEILSKNGISHWGAYGTVLGAVRHKGFIPWDDDFDICISNVQMNRAIEVLKKELPSYLKIITFENTPEFRATYIKIQDSRRDVVAQIEEASGTTRPHGVYVDLFPIDGVPDAWIDRLCLRLKSMVLFCIWNARYNPSRRKTWKYYASVIIAFLATPLLPRIKSVGDVLKIRKRWADKYPFGDSEFCGRYIGGWNKDYGWKVRSTIFSKAVYLEFESMKIPVPSGFNEYLTELYGNWHEPPPLSHRCSPFHEDLTIAPWKFGPTGEG